MGVNQPWSHSGSSEIKCSLDPKGYERVYRAIREKKGRKYSETLDIVNDKNEKAEKRETDKSTEVKGAYQAWFVAVSQLADGGTTHGRLLREGEPDWQSSQEVGI